MVEKNIRRIYFIFKNCYITRLYKKFSKLKHLDVKIIFLSVRPGIFLGYSYQLFHYWIFKLVWKGYICQVLNEELNIYYPYDRDDPLILLGSQTPTKHLVGSSAYPGCCQRFTCLLLLGRSSLLLRGVIPTAASRIAMYFLYLILSLSLNTRSRKFWSLFRWSNWSNLQYWKLEAAVFLDALCIPSQSY